MVIGYLIGSISISVIITKKYKKQDIRQLGSKNAGATNTLRTYGKKMALIVFTFDTFKSIIPMVIAYFFAYYTKYNVIVALAGFAAVIGHIWPIYFKFQGGKGAATFLGFIVACQWILFFFGIIIFMKIVIKTKKVSLGSIIARFFLWMILLASAFIPGLNKPWSQPLTYVNDWWVTFIIFGVIWSLVVYKHRQNIIRLLQGTENKITIKSDK